MWSVVTFAQKQELSVRLRTFILEDLLLSGIGSIHAIELKIEVLVLIPRIRYSYNGGSTRRLAACAHCRDDYISLDFRFQ